MRFPLFMKRTPAAFLWDRTCQQVFQEDEGDCFLRTAFSWGGLGTAQLDTMMWSNWNHQLNRLLNCQSHLSPANIFRLPSMSRPRHWSHSWWWACSLRRSWCHSQYLLLCLDKHFFQAEWERTKLVNLARFVRGHFSFTSGVNGWLGFTFSDIFSWLPIGLSSFKVWVANCHSNLFNLFQCQDIDVLYNGMFKVSYKNLSNGWVMIYQATVSPLCL